MKSTDVAPRTVQRITIVYIFHFLFCVSLVEQFSKKLAIGCPNEALKKNKNSDSLNRLKIDETRNLVRSVLPRYSIS